MSTSIPGRGRDHKDQNARNEKKLGNEHKARHGGVGRTESPPMSETTLALKVAARAAPSSALRPSSGAAITFADVTKRFPTARGGMYTAIRDVNLEIRPGEFCTVVGPTGCGKSTMLGLVSGLIRPSSGTVAVDGRHVTGIGDRIGYVFQSDAV